MYYTVHGILQARILESVVFTFSRGSSQPRDQTQVSCIAGRFFPSWATREAQEYWSGYSIPSPGELSYPGIQPWSPALQADSLPTELSGKPNRKWNTEMKRYVDWKYRSKTLRVCAQSLQSCPTLSNPMDCSPPSSSVHGILQARILEWVAMPSLQAIFPNQRLNQCLLHLLHHRRILYRWATREAQ